MITAPSSDLDPGGSAHDGEARLLVELLRTSRLTLLFCEAGNDKTAFLKAALMPLLRRRAGDRVSAAAARESSVIVPFPDRRRGASDPSSKPRREVVVHFDDWSGSPLPALLACVHQAANTGAAERDAPWQRLGDTLESLSIRLDANFIILLDRFEEFLLAPPEREGQAEFVSEWVEAVLRPQLPASFLIALNDDARPRLASLRSRIPGFDDFSLKLTRPPGFKPPVVPPPPPEPSAAAVIELPPVLTQTVETSELLTPAAPQPAAVPASRSVRKPKVKRPAQPRSEVKTEDVYALIEATLARTTPPISDETFPEDLPLGDFEDTVSDLSPPPPPAVAAPAKAAPPGGWRAVFRGVGRLFGLWSKP